MENLTVTPPVLIEKEIIPSLKFGSCQVFRTPEEDKMLRKKLNRCTALGNLDRRKIKIIFKDSEGLKQVETTIWATGDRNIVLKSGIIIPIKNIVEVKKY